MAKKASTRKVSTTSSVSTAIQNDAFYDALEAHVKERVATMTGETSLPIYTTDADPDKLWQLYLSLFPEDRRQHYNCHCCRRFIQKYGTMVTGVFGSTPNSIFWGTFPGEMPLALRQMDQLVSKAKITGVFLWSEQEKVWGTPTSKDKEHTWTHLSGKALKATAKSKVETPYQLMAEKLEDYKMLKRALADYSLDVAKQALRVLEQGSLYRSEKAQEVAVWFHNICQRVQGIQGKHREDLLWYEVHAAPTGFCHVRSQVIGTLLDDIKEGLSFEAISKRWAEKLNPLQYQRPTAAPSAGSIDQAEKLVEKLGVASALDRRFAKLEDVLKFEWQPKEEPPQREEGGVFGHLKQPPKGKVVELELPAVKMTYEKFKKTVLPNVYKMWAYTPYGSASYYGLVTAADPEAAAILQWDGLEGHARNPVSWYYYSNGSTPEMWGLRSSTWVDVTGVFLSPPQWQEPEKFKHMGPFVCFALKDCKDQRSNSLGLFPETLKSEYHGIRKVIEAHSNKGRIAGKQLGTANGLSLSGNSHRGQSIKVRVKTDGGFANYELDRLD